MQLFHDKDSNAYFGEIINTIKQQKDQSNPTCSDVLAPIILHEDKKQQTAEKVLISHYNFSSKVFKDQPEYFVDEGIKITFTIPFSGDPVLLKLRPSTSILRPVCIDAFNEAKDKKGGTVSIEIRYTNKELQRRKPNEKEFIEERFSNCLVDLRTMIGYINQDAERFNRRFHAVVSS